MTKPNETRLRKFHEEGVGVRETARRMKVSHNTIRNWKKQLGLDS